jgi:hypothetical protein
VDDKEMMLHCGLSAYDTVKFRIVFLKRWDVALRSLMVDGRNLNT